MSFFGELKRRNVVKVAAAYAIVGWLLIEVTSTVFPLVQLPEWTATFVAMLILVGFPIALILSWAYELTPDGMKRSQEVEATESISHVTGRKIDFAIIGALVLALGFVAFDQYVLEEASETEIVADESVEAPPPVVVEEQREPLPNSVAVLPLANLSPDPDNDYFAAGIHDTILNELAKLQNLNVIARTSVLQFANGQTPISEIADILNVETVMEGSVQYADGRILVTAQLIDPETNSHLWSDNYDREFADIFAIQADIAMNIANAVGAEFSLEEQARIEARPTDSAAAYALYLSAISRPAGINDGRLAIQDLDAAIELDAGFALAFAQRAWRYAVGLVYANEVPLAEYERNAIASAEQALALDRTIGLTHSVIAAIDELNWRWADARRRSALALELSPNDVYVLTQYVRFTRSAGDYDVSIRANERWARLEPTATLPYIQLAVVHRFARNYDAAVAAALKVIEINPANAGGRVHLALAEVGRGNRDKALQVLQIAEQLFGGNFEQVFRVGQMAMAYSLLDRREGAERMLTLLERLDQESPVGERSGRKCISHLETLTRRINISNRLWRNPHRQTTQH